MNSEKILELITNKKKQIEDLNNDITQYVNELKKPKQCDECGQVFASLKYYEIHIKKIHRNDYCKICRESVDDILEHICQCKYWIIDKSSESGTSRCPIIFKKSYDKRVHHKNAHSLVNRCKSEKCILTVIATRKKIKKKLVVEE